MKAQILSDLHLEFGLCEFDFSKPDMVILAGDVHVGLKGVDWISQRIMNKPVIYVLGNHEYYKNSYPRLLHKIITKTAGTNIHLLENSSYQFEGATIHGCTLWTDFEVSGNPQHSEYECQRVMNDYHLIRKDPSYSKLRPVDTKRIHMESLNWLRNSLINSKTRINIVVTHHAPSIKSVSKNPEDVVTAAYASNLEELIHEHSPDLWIHGHIHECTDYYIGGTRIVCNPKGYPDEKVVGYHENFMIDLSACLFDSNF